MLDRLPLTAIPVLGGLVPGVTATVSSVVAPLQLFTPAGLAAPVVHRIVALLLAVKVSIVPAAGTLYEDVLQSTCVNAVPEPVCWHPMVPPLPPAVDAP